MSETAGAEVTSDAPEPDAPDPRAEIEAAASKGGWTPKDEWTGKPEEWLDAPQFVLKGAEILPEVRKALKEARDENRGIKKTLNDLHSHLTRTEQRMYEKARRDLETELDQHALDGNVEGVRAVTKDLAKLAEDAAVKPPGAPQEAQNDPVVDDWIKDNAWFNSDPVMAAAAKTLSGIVEGEGITDIGKNLAEVTRRIKARFPDAFENPRRTAPGAVEASSAPRTGGKNFNDLPADAKAMCLDFEKNIKGFKREQYVKEWFAA